MKTSVRSEEMEFCAPFGTGRETLGETLLREGTGFLVQLGMIWAVVSLLGMAVPFVAFYRSLYFRSARRWTEFLPTSKVKDVFVGFVELNGKAESGADGPIIAPLSRRECVWTSREVEELRRGNKNRRYWETIIEERCDRPFYLSDETGRVLIDPTGAEIDAEILFEEEIDARDPRFFSGGKMLRRDSCKVRRFVERGVPLDSKVYVLGKTRIDDDAVAPVVKKDDSKWVYRIALGTEKDARESGGSAEKEYFGLAVLSAANFGAAFRAILWGTGWDGSGMEFEFAGGWSGLGNVLLVGATCGAIVATLWALCATIEFINAFIELRRRVDQARSNVEVELKRRFDLLPQLATATMLAARLKANCRRSWRRCGRRGSFIGSIRRKTAFALGRRAS